MAKVQKTIVQENSKRSILSQRDVPSMTLDKSLKVAKAIVDNYASKPVTPLQIAKALELSPTSSSFKMLCGASIAYGLTSGGYGAELIDLQPLVLRILKPKKESDDLRAKIEAFLIPRVIKEFVAKYNGSPIPKDSIAKNVLEEMGVPLDKLDYVFSIIMEEGERIGVITEIKGKKYIEVPTDFDNKKKEDNNVYPYQESSISDSIEENEGNDDVKEIQGKLTDSKLSVESEDTRLKKVFITHGKNRDFIDPIKKLLKFGELEAIVSVDKTSVSVPVPDKVMNDMRTCGAAIIHVEGEAILFDKEGKEQSILNPNVLIEIGAAMALYGRRFILLVKDGAKLPSNLQGLFEVRYNGNSLDGDATIRLLEAINDIKNQSLPK